MSFLFCGFNQIWFPLGFPAAAGSCSQVLLDSHIGRSLAGLLPSKSKNYTLIFSIYVTEKLEFLVPTRTLHPYGHFLKTESLDLEIDRVTDSS